MAIQLTQAKMEKEILKGPFEKAYIDFGGMFKKHKIFTHSLLRLDIDFEISCNGINVQEASVAIELRHGSKNSLPWLTTLVAEAKIGKTFPKKLFEKAYIKSDGSRSGINVRRGINFFHELKLKILS